MTTVLRIVAWLGLSLLTVLVVIALYVAMNWDKSYDVPAPDLHASTDPDIIRRGEYLVLGPAHCIECHVNSQNDYDAFFETGVLPPLSGGYPFPLGPLGTLYARNITPDADTGIGRYSDPLVARMLRHGVRGDNKVSVPALMPFGDMSDDDIVAILSFLRSLTPVRRAVPENEWTAFGKVMKTFVSATKPRLEVHPPATAPPQEASVARGEYLARWVADCGGCHTAFNEMTGAPTVPPYSGGNLMEPMKREGVDPALWFQPPNITPREGSALLRFPDRATFVARFKNGGRKYAGSPMPWEAFARMTVEDIGAVYEFLQTQPPSGNAALEDPRVRR